MNDQMETAQWPTTSNDPGTLLPALRIALSLPPATIGDAMSDSATDSEVSLWTRQVGVCTRLCVNA